MTEAEALEILNHTCLLGYIRRDTVWLESGYYTQEVLTALVTAAPGLLAQLRMPATA